MMYLQLAGGLLLLLGAAEVMIRGAVGLARSFGMSPLFIGMTVVAMGTSAPEFVVSLDAALTGSGGVATGNIIGSNIANILLIIGAAALLAPVARRRERLFRDSALLMLCSLLFVMLGWQGDIGLAGGVLLLIIFAAFMGSAYWRDINNPEASAERVHEVEEIGTVPTGRGIALAATLGGLAGITLGADLLVTGGVAVAREHGMSEEMIGLTLIAVGTSLPELAASVVAAVRGHADVSLGNIVGSNMFNMLGVGGVVALVSPLPFSSAMLAFDVWVMLGAAALITPVMLGLTGLSRIGGGIFVLSYALYIWSHIAGLPGKAAERVF